MLSSSSLSDVLTPEESDSIEVPVDAGEDFQSRMMMEQEEEGTLLTEGGEESKDGEVSTSINRVAVCIIRSRCLRKCFMISHLGNHNRFSFVHIFVKQA